MKLLTLLAALLLVSGATVASAAKPPPTGSFTISPGPHLEGGTVGFTFGEIRNVTNNYEVTLGVRCVLPDGTGIPWGNRSNPYIYEFNSFGNVYSGVTVTFPEGPNATGLPVYGTGYDCVATLIAALWKNGVPVQGWQLDQHTFTVEP